MFGMSMVMMPIITNGLNQLPTRLNPHGTAINNTAQQVSGSIGTAVLVTIMNSVTKTEAESMMTGIDPTTVTEQSMALLGQQALLSGIQYSFLVTLGINIVAIVLALFLKRVDVSSREAISKIEEAGKEKVS